MKNNYIRKNVRFSLLTFFRNICRIFLFKIFFVTQICEFKKLYIKVTYYIYLYNMLPYLFEIAEDMKMIITS